MSSVYIKHFFSFQICALDVFLFRWFVVKWDFQGPDHIWPELVPISAGECNPSLLLSCLIIRWSDCVAVLCHIPTLSAPHFSQYIYSRVILFSLNKSLLPLSLSFSQLWLTRIFDVPYFTDWQDWTECWALQEITRRKVEQQQCTDYRQDLCEEHMISSLILLSDWLWWRGLWLRGSRSLDSFRQSQIKTERDDSCSIENHLTVKSDDFPTKNILTCNHKSTICSIGRGSVYVIG